MLKQTYNVIGVMSGTSLDGVDLAYITLLLKNGAWRYNISFATTKRYTDEWVAKLKEAVNYNAAQLAELNHDYTVLLSTIINNFITSNNLQDIDIIASHGHTVLHQPEKGITLQIGNLENLAKLTGFTTVCDFRVEDVALGGQGAPLVPIGDRYLFGEYEYCLNLGGFSNISFEEGGKRIAFDISPVNTVLNHYANLLGHEYDDGGRIAGSGKIVPQLLEKLDNMEYYSRPYPKSLGFEFVKNEVFPLMETFEASVPDKLHTFTVHIARQTAAVVKKPKARLLVTGGGAYNKFLIDKITEMLPGTAVCIPDDKTIQYKEALIFALLGVLKLRGEINALASVTGAKHDHSSGKIYVP